MNEGDLILEFAEAIKDKGFKSFSLTYSDTGCHMLTANLEEKKLFLVTIKSVPSIIEEVKPTFNYWQRVENLPRG